MRSKQILLEASILPAARRYQFWNVMLAVLASIVGIIVLPIIIPIALWAIKRYYDSLEVVLTKRDLQVRRGILTKEEKTIPLEKITDLALVEGPLMRLMGIKGIAVETAGQSSGGALVKVIGIEDIENFRDTVLEQRDRVSDHDDDEPSSPSSPDTESLEVLASIRDSLLRIEKTLKQNDN